MNGSRFAPRDADELRSSEIVYESAAPSARPSAPPAASTYLVYEPSNIDDVKIVKRKLVKLLPSTPSRHDSLNHHPVADANGTNGLGRHETPGITSAPTLFERPSGEDPMPSTKNPSTLNPAAASYSGNRHDIFAKSGSTPAVESAYGRLSPPPASSPNVPSLRSDGNSVSDESVIIHMGRDEGKSRVTMNENSDGRSEERSNPQNHASPAAERYEPPPPRSQPAKGQRPAKTSKFQKIRAAEIPNLTAQLYDDWNPSKSDAAPTPWKRTDIWPKIPAHDPRDQETGVDEAWDDVPSNVADFDEDVTLQHNGWNQDYALGDGNGNWVPAPSNWEMRSSRLDQNKRTLVLEWWDQTKAEGAFDSHLHQLSRRLRSTYDQDTQAGLMSKEDPLKAHDYHSDQEGHICKLLGEELAPRSWYPVDIDGVDTEDWWAEHIRDPDYMDGIPDIAPWWHRYPTPVDEYLTLVTALDAKLDPEDNEMARIKNQTSESSVVERLAAKKPRKAPQPESMLKERRKADVLNNRSYAPIINEHSPQINIFLRPAEERDLPQVKDILNHYIANTIWCPEMEARTKADVKGRWEDVEAAKLPFLVAVDRSSKGNRTRTPNTIGIREHVVGFGYADDYNDMGGMYRYTVEVEVFTDPDFVKYGVARTLLDKLIHVLDSHYLSRGGYEFASDSTDYTSGGRRSVACILVNVPHSKEDESFAWKTKWLEQFDFIETGTLKGIGRKLNQTVDLSLYKRDTSLTIGSWAP